MAGDGSGGSDDNMLSIIEVADRGGPLVSREIRSMLPSTSAAPGTVRMPTSAASPLCWKTTPSGSGVISAPEVMFARRIVLTGFVATLLAGCQTTAQTASPVAIDRVRVDTGPLATKGQSATAAAIKPMLERELASLRTTDVGHGATLHVAVTGLYLASYAGGQSVTLGNDTLESEVRLIGGRRPRDRPLPDPRHHGAELWRRLVSAGRQPAPDRSARRQQRAMDPAGDRPVLTPEPPARPIRFTRSARFPIVNTTSFRGRNNDAARSPGRSIARGRLRRPRRRTVKPGTGAGPGRFSSGVAVAITISNGKVSEYRFGRRAANIAYGSVSDDRVSFSPGSAAVITLTPAGPNQANYSFSHPQLGPATGLLSKSVSRNTSAPAHAAARTSKAWHGTMGPGRRLGAHRLTGQRGLSLSWRKPRRSRTSAPTTAD
jgi:hypothetical protein